MTREGPRRSGCFVQDAPAEAMDRLESPRPSAVCLQNAFCRKARARGPAGSPVEPKAPPGEGLAAPASMAVLPALAAGFGGFLTVVGEVAAALLTAFLPCLGGFFAIVGEVAGVGVFGSHESAPRMHRIHWVGRQSAHTVTGKASPDNGSKKFRQWLKHRRIRRRKVSARGGAGRRPPGRRAGGSPGSSGRRCGNPPASAGTPARPPAAAVSPRWPAAPRARRG